MYKEVFWKSVKNLKFSLFLPDLYLMLVEILLAFFFIKFTGIYSLLNHPDFIAASIEDKLPLLTSFISENILTLLLYFAVFFFTSFILGASLNSMRYGMIRDVVVNEHYSFRKVVNYGVRFWPIVVVRVIIFFLGVVTFLFILGSYKILSSYYSQSSALFVVTTLAIVAVFFLKLLFMFTYAIMFFEKKGAFSSVKNSFVYFFRNKFYVIKVFFILLFLSIIVLPFEYIFLHYQNLFGLISFYTLIFLIVRNLVSIFYTVWSELLVFYSYTPKCLSP